MIDLCLIAVEFCTCYYVSRASWLSLDDTFLTDRWSFWRLLWCISTTTLIGGCILTDRWIFQRLLQAYSHWLADVILTDRWSFQRLLWCMSILALIGWYSQGSISHAQFWLSTLDSVWPQVEFLETFSGSKGFIALIGALSLSGQTLLGEAVVNRRCS